MPRRKEPERRIDEIREQAKEVAGKSGEALKDFAEQTGSAAKDFASKTRVAAKELIEAIESAAQKVEPEAHHRGRKLLGAAIVVGIGAAIVANDKLRETIGSLVGRRDREPEPWEPRVAEQPNGAIASVSGTAE